MFRKGKVSKFLNKSIHMYRNKQDGKPKIFFSGGVHNYENSSQHLYNIMDANEPILDEYDLFVIPEMNRANFLGLNRVFDYKNIPYEYKFLKDVNPFNLAVDFHGDCSGIKFYLYERHKKGLKPIGQEIFKRLDDIPTQGFVPVGYEKENTLEELNYKLGSDYSITTETPMGYFYVDKEQVKFNEKLAIYILEAFKIILI